MKFKTVNSAISDNRTNIETLQTDVTNINTSIDGKLYKTGKASLGAISAEIK